MIDAEEGKMVDPPMVACVFDCRPGRLLAISEWLKLRFGDDNVKSGPLVPSEGEIEAFVKGLGSRWAVVLHVGNDRSVELARAALLSLGHGRSLALYSGGNNGNFASMEKRLGPTFRGHGYVRCVPYVSRNWLQPLQAAINEMEELWSMADRGADGRPPEEQDASRSVGPSVREVRDRMQEFEELRAHVSHDLFTNAFCVPLGFHCTEVDSPRRRDLLVWARSDDRWWKNLCGPASRWVETRRAVEDVLQRAEAFSGDTHMMVAFREVVNGSQLAMGTIDRLMGKFAESSFEEAGMTDEEIDSFWAATDTIRHALQSVRVTDRGLDPTFFSQIFLPDELAAREER